MKKVKEFREINDNPTDRRNFLKASLGVCAVGAAVVTMSPKVAAAEVQETLGTQQVLPKVNGLSGTWWV